MILTFKSGPDTATGLTGDHAAICMGPDGKPRITAATQTRVQFWRGGAISTVADAGAMKVVGVGDGVSLTCNAAGIVVVTGRCRTKGGKDQSKHGPWQVIIPASGAPSPCISNTFTSGAVRCIFDGPGPNVVELWSKDGQYLLVDAVTGLSLGHGDDRCGGTGEKIAVCAGGYRAFSGYHAVNSAVICRGKWRADVMNTKSVYDCGDDTNYCGIGVLPLKGLAYYMLAYSGRLLYNVIKAGHAIYDIGNLPSAGDASGLIRHAPQAVACRGRMAAVYSHGQDIMAVDVDGAHLGTCKPVKVASGSLAAAVANGTSIELATVRGGQVYWSTVQTGKG